PWVRTHAVTRLRSSNNRERSTDRSRTTGNLVSGSSVIGLRSGDTFSISVEHACRVRPLINMVHAPHTSSKHPLSHTGVVVGLPSVVVGWAAMYWRAEI